MTPKAIKPVWLFTPNIATFLIIFDTHTNTNLFVKFKSSYLFFFFLKSSKINYKTEI